MSLLLNLYKLYTSVWSYVQQEMHRDGGELQGGLKFGSEHPRLS